MKFFNREKMMKYGRILLCGAVVLLFILACDARYRYTVIAEFPQGEVYKVAIKKNNNVGDWFLSDGEIRRIEERQYSSVAKILEKSMIGPGVRKVDLEKTFWEDIGQIKVVNITSLKETELSKRDIEIFNRSNGEILIYLKIK